MYALCLRYAATTAEAEDMVIEGFAKVFNKIDRFDGRNLESWMKTLFVREAINLFHKNKNKTWAQSREIDEADALNEEEILAELSLKELKFIIGTLPDGCRMVFNLYAIEGYLHHEIAGLLGISESTSKSQYIRAKQLLQTKLKTREEWKTMVL